MRLLCALFLFSTAVFGAPGDWFGIQIVDDQSGRGVPLITLSTTNHRHYVSDSAGWIAFQEPGLMEGEVYFHVSGPGYTVAKDGFGFAGVRLKPRPGATATVKVQRTQMAERLYRITGQGIYSDSLLLGEKTPLSAGETPPLVMGQDSVQALPWKGRLFWLWGDTNIPSYPLGNFHTTCGVSDLPSKGGLSPSQGIRLDYLTDAGGKLRKMIPSSEKGVVWVFGLLSAQDASGKDHLLGHYGRYERLDKRVEHGLVRWDEILGHFVPVTKLTADNTWRHPVGNAVRVTNADGDFFYFMESFAVTRVKATSESVLDPAAYEALAWSPADHDYRWQKEQAPITQAAEALKVKQGEIPAPSARLQIRDAATGDPVLIHRASVNWNAHRQRWIMIATQDKGDVSLLGEIVYSEALDPSGPWTRAVKIASHPRYTFYNPRHHAFFDEDNGRFIYFEGTYTETFSGNPVATPGYDYNQVMYSLDLDDKRLAVFD